MPSKMVVDKQKSASTVIACGRTNAALVAAAITKKTGPFLAQGTDSALYEKCLTQSIFASCDLLEAKSNAMANADEAYLVEAADDDAPRQRREKAFQALYELLVEMRESCQGAFGAKELTGFGFSSATPRDPAQLTRFAGEILAAFQKRKAQMPPTRKGISFDPGALLEALSTHREALTSALKEIATEERELQTALAEKNRTISEYDEAFLQVANFLEGLFLLAGMSELADKVRPSLRRPGQTIEEEQESTPQETN